MLTRQERAWLRLHLTKGLGRRGLIDLQGFFQSPEDALQAGPANWPKKVGGLLSVNLELPCSDGAEYAKAVAALEQCTARIISLWDDDYPELLKTIHDPPALLYVLGNISRDPALAMVGSRRCSATGMQITRRFAREIAESGFTIISGLARGIDSNAHEGALDVEGNTIAVLGCGIDYIYPPENRKLFGRISEQGAIISEYPPGTRPLPGHFPGRNRIISGLSQGVLVVEAASGSGSLITAEFALEQGREIFAVPGALTAPNSDGVNSLLKQGAHLVTEPQDILNILQPGARTTGFNNTLKLLENLTDQEKELVEQLSDEPIQIDDLARKSGLTPMELSAILLQLELQGAVSQLPGMRYIRSL
jgi:DNA processing protein